MRFIVALLLTIIVELGMVLAKLPMPQSTAQIRPTPPMRVVIVPSSPIPVSIVGDCPLIYSCAGVIGGHLRVRLYLQ